MKVGGDWHGRCFIEDQEKQNPLPDSRNTIPIYEIREGTQVAVRQGRKKGDKEMLKGLLKQGNRYTIGMGRIKKASRLSIWVSNNALGNVIYKGIRLAVKPFGVETHKRYRRAKAGQKYGWGGSLRREHAVCFAIYFERERRTA
jgi:hypothetical protein